MIFGQKLAQKCACVDNKNDQYWHVTTPARSRKKCEYRVKPLFCNIVITPAPGGPPDGIESLES